MASLDFHDEVRIALKDNFVDPGSYEWGYPGVEFDSPNPGDANVWGRHRIDTASVETVSSRDDTDKARERTRGTVVIEIFSDVHATDKQIRVIIRDELLPVLRQTTYTSTRFLTPNAFPVGEHKGWLKWIVEAPFFADQFE